VRFVAEGDSHCLFEVRVHRIGQRGDASISGFEVEEILADTMSRATSPDKAKKTVSWAGDAAGRQTQTASGKKSQGLLMSKRTRIGLKASGEALYFFARFQALNFYYQQVSKQLGGGITPNFYRFRLAPTWAPMLNRVYEVEEHVGRLLLEGLAEMHLSHQRLTGHGK